MNSKQDSNLNFIQNIWIQNKAAGLEYLHSMKNSQKNFGKTAKLPALQNYVLH